MLENRRTAEANVDKKDCTEGHPQHSPLFINFFWGRAELFAGGDHFVNPTQQFCLPAVVQRAADKQETAQRDDLHADQIGSGGADCLRNLVRISLLAVHQQGDILRLRFIQPAAEATEASGSFEQVKAIVEGAPEGFCVYSGDDSATYDIMKLGGVGVISTIGNVAPARMKEIVELCAAGKWEEAAAANERLMPLMEGLFKTANPILVKEALKLAGFPVGGVRLPLVNATAEQSAELERTMREVGVL